MTGRDVVRAVGSTVGELTLAVSVSVPEAGAVTFTFTLLTWPLAKTQLQLTRAGVQSTQSHSQSSLPPQRVRHHTPLALDGPKFVTDIV